jgi:single-strand DNA-binding protein
MANLNRVFIIGNLTRDPELRYTPSGTAVATIRMATNRKYKAKNGEQKDEVCFLTVVAWDRQAEVCNQYLHKGSPLFVEGRLQSRTWDGADGKKRSVLEIRAERVQFLGTGTGAAKTSAPAEEGPAASSTDEKLEEKSDAVPFSPSVDEVSWGQETSEDMS